MLDACEPLDHRAQPLAERFVYTRVRVVVPFDALGTAYRLVSAPDVVLAGERFGGTNEFEFDVRQSLVEEFLRMLRERRLIANTE